MAEGGCFRRYRWVHKQLDGREHRAVPAASNAHPLGYQQSVDSSGLAETSVSITYSCSTRKRSQNVGQLSSNGHRLRQAQGVPAFTTYTEPRYNVSMRVLACAIFWGLLVPAAILVRLVGFDPLRRRYKPNATTYWQSCRHDPPEAMTKQT